MTPDDKLSALIDRVLGHLRTPLEADVHAFARDFSEQADAARASAVEQAVTDVRREAAAQLEQLRSELEQVRRTAEAELSDIRRLAAAEIEGARRHAAAQLDEAQRQSSEVLAAARRDTDEVRAGLERVQRELADAHRAAEAAARERVTLQQSLEDVRHAATLASETLGGVAARTQQMVDTVRAIDAAGSIGDVLEHLAYAAKSYAQRSVLLMVRGPRLAAWRTSDFPGATELPVDDGSLIGAAIRRRVPQIHLEGTPDTTGSLPSFAADAGARDAVALPIVLGGEAVAVIYADAPRGSDTTDRRWPLTLEVVTGYASRVIEVMTLQRSIGLAVPARAPQTPPEPETLS